MKDFAKSIHVGNAGGNLDAAAARDIREMAAKYWHSGIHDTRQLATTVAWEWAKKSKTVRDTTQDLVSEVKDIIDRSLNEIKTGNKKVGNGLSDSYEFLMSAGKNDYNSIKEEVKKVGGWTPEIKAKARKTSDTLKKKAKELVETAHKQSAELERLAGDIESI